MAKRRPNEPRRLSDLWKGSLVMYEGVKYTITGVNRFTDKIHWYYLRKGKILKRFNVKNPSENFLINL